jgi:CHAT domain-containing protein
VPRGGDRQPSPSVPPPVADAPRETTATAVAAERRWINAGLEDHEPNEPLATGQWYTLAFDVDTAERKSSVAVSPFAETNLYPDGTDEVVITVQLDSADFQISDRTRPLRVPKRGPSRGKARFDISPQRDGSATIKATFHKEGNFIQEMNLKFQIGAAEKTRVEVTTRGRPVSAAGVVQPRDVGISISPAAGGGYDCVVWGNVSSRAKLTIKDTYLANAIEVARQELLKVVMHESASGDYVFQLGVDIPPADRDVALRIMARAGALLFRKIFYGPAAGKDSVAVGDWLRKVGTDRSTRLKIQILAESTPVPWGLLYLGDASEGATLDWDNFIGMRHIIEQIPLQNTLAVSDCAIPSNDPALAVSLNVNTGIDTQMGVQLVAGQQMYWSNASKARKSVSVKSRTTSSEVMHALASGATDDQILYFYCHAESTGLTDGGGPDASCLVLTDARLTLSDLSLDAPTETQLRGNPLVFINACESAELSPAFYDGFVPYFMAKGARGVIGTECKTPALFAATWAERFFDRFLGGQPLGDTFLELRREFLEQHGNPLGLLYAVHCDGDTQVRPAL